MKEQSKVLRVVVHLSIYRFEYRVVLGVDITGSEDYLFFRVDIDLFFRECQSREV
jgi:hypothetical protein